MMNRSRPLLLNTICEMKACMSTNTKIPNHYEVLNIPHNSTQDDIKSAYYDLTKKYHPDRNTSSDAKTKFQKISNAYEVLGNFTKRKQYDRDLMARGHRATVESSTAPAYGVRRTVEIDPLAAFYKSRLGNDPNTPIYNFDDWTRAHYGRSLKRSIEERQTRNLNQRMRIKEYEKDLEHNKSAATFILLSTLLLMMTLSVYSNYEREKYDNNRLSERKANEMNFKSSSN